MLTVKRSAEILNVSPGLVYALCAQGKLEHERFGIGRGTIRIAESALADFRAGARPASRVRPVPRSSAVFKHLNPERLTQAWRERGVELPSPPPR
jgi:excisionase family DNA binding protein